MFFLTRATVCIGLVAAAASAAGGGGLGKALDRDARDAATRLGRACVASPRCLQTGTGMVAGALPLLGGGSAPLPASSRADAARDGFAATTPEADQHRPLRRAARPRRAAAARA